MVEHFDGCRPARIPRPQMMLKTPPTSGLRRAEASGVVDGKWTSSMLIPSPRKESAKSNIDVKPASLVKSSPVAFQVRL